MKMFSKEKDLIHRIVNLIFIVWFVTTLIFLYNGLINVIVKQPAQSYSVYKVNNCNIKDCSETSDSVCTAPDLNDETVEEKDCRSKYELYLSDNKRRDVVYKKNIISSTISFFTVSITLYLLNKKRLNN